MQLWSFHTPGFSLTSGVIDPNLSSYTADVPTLRECYDELARRLGLPKYEIVWCYVRPDWKPEAYHGYVQWDLDVPEHGFLAVVESEAWNRILGINDAIPEFQVTKWHREAEQLGLSRGDYVKEKKKEYAEQAPPLGDWWSSLRCDLTADDATVLLRHPIAESWVVSKTVY